MRGFLSFLQGEEMKTSPPTKEQKNNYDKLMTKLSPKIESIPKSKKVTVTSPQEFSEIQKLIDSLAAKEGILVDFSKTNVTDAQRMLDFLSGAVYAVKGNIKLVENKMYLMTPCGVDILTKLKKGKRKSD